MSDTNTATAPVAAPAKPAKAKPAKKPAKPAKKTPVDRAKPVSDAIRNDIVKFMRKGKEYTSREIVEGVGREPGPAGGGPVVRILKELVAERLVAHANAEGKRGQCWVKK